MGCLTSLTELDLGRVGFSGPIPSTFSELKELALVDLSENLLTGPIPPSFSELRGLVSLDLDDNLITTPIPSFHMYRKAHELEPCF
ncbi:hypothetical protein C2S51_029762 [Perilla frutescens var. frutescens]|nr:hypothetical protein C2S51_029762 [Perilla frutescens var. frutescens]